MSYNFFNINFSEFNELYFFRIYIHFFKIAKILSIENKYNFK